MARRSPRSSRTGPDRATRTMRVAPPTWSPRTASCAPCSTTTAEPRAAKTSGPRAPPRGRPDREDGPGDVPPPLFGVTNLPSSRLAIDMTDLDGARIVITTGQSGNPFAEHYGDLIDEWSAGRWIPPPFSRA